MALTRKMLSAMGIEEEKQDEIITAHVDVVDALKEERDKFKADAKKVKDLQDEVKSLQDAMKSGEKSPYKVKYEAKIEELDKLQKEFDDYKANINAEKTAEKKAAAYKELLIKAGVSEKRVNSIVKVTDLNKVEFDGDGNVKDAGKLTEDIKSEWADFIVTESKQGAKTANPATNTGGAAKTKKEIMAIKDTTERQNAWAEYLENGGEE